MTKSHLLPIFKCQYLVEILRYGSNFLHVIITFIGFKITFSNIRSHGAPLLISRGWRLAPPPGFLTIQNTLGLIGLRRKNHFHQGGYQIPPPLGNRVNLVDAIKSAKYGGTLAQKGRARVLSWSKLVNFFFQTSRQRINSNLQPGLRSIRLSVPEE